VTRTRGGLGRGLASLIPAGPASPMADVLISPLVSRETVTAKESAQRSSDRPVSGATEPSPGAGSVASTNKPAAPTPRRGRIDEPEPKAEERIAGPAEAVSVQDVGDMEVSRETTPEIPATEPQQGPHYLEVPTADISPNPHNPRTVFDEEALAELTHSIREFGLLQPVVIRERQGGGYELVMGERRWRAAQRVGLPTIPAIVRRTEDADLLRNALLENIHRANLNPLEEAAAYQQLLDEFDVTHDELAARLGRSRPVISNTIRLLKLPVPVQRRVAAGVLSAGHARALLALDEPGAQETLAARIVAEGLSVRGTEEAVTLLAGRKQTSRRPVAKREVSPGIEDLAAKLGDHLDTRVLIELSRRRGRIVIDFATTDDLSRIADVIRGRNTDRQDQRRFA
jgi:ParB family chromosome partitioning protein